MKRSQIVMLIVLAIIAVLTATAFWWLKRTLDQVRWNYSRDQLKIAADALDRFHDERGCYPTIEEYRQLAASKDWDYPYDMWGTLLIYEPNGCKGFRIACLGRDQIIGGKGPDADIELTRMAETKPAN